MEERVGVGGEKYKKMRQATASLVDVPLDIMIDIISRLPIKTIASCKSVCKSWLNLLTSPEFVKCHLSKSKPSLVFWPYNMDNHNMSSLYHVIEFESYSTITIFDPVEFKKYKYLIMEGSVNGLMSCCMVDKDASYSSCICNPITREYIELSRPQERGFEIYYECCGFGVSKINDQYKVVRIPFDNKRDHLMCEVYTLGTRSWRTVSCAPDVPLLQYFCTSKSAFLNGNLHWLAKDFEGHCWISCFDLETEQFSIFSMPVGIHKTDLIGMELIASGECLRLIDDDYNHREIVVWSMKEYGVYESWTKECVIRANLYLDGQYHRSFRVINVFSNGDILIELCEQRFCYYSSTSKTGRLICISELPNYRGMLRNPSFLSLKSTFAMEDVKFF